MFRSFGALVSCLCVLILHCATMCAQVADYYVAKDGKDSWSGTLSAPNSTQTDGPFATIHRAQKAVRAILANPQGRTTPIKVGVRRGKYFQSTTLQFGTADSGTSTLRVLWENYPGERPVISGGIPVTGWTNVTGNEWQATLAATTQNFEQLFYNNERRLRPRLGSSVGNNLGAYYRVAATVYLQAPPPPSPAPDPNCSVYVTNSGWECFDRFQYSSSDPISSTWQNLAPPSGNPCNQPAGNPNLVGDIELIDFEVWSVSKLRISCIDSANLIIYTTGPTSTSLPAAHGFLVGHRYMVENIHDLLQQPGQWFLDRSATPWVLTYLANPGEDPNTHEVIIPQVSPVMTAYGLQYVTFSGLTFQNDNYVVPAAGYQSSHGDPNAPSAVSCQNCSNVSFNSDIITQTSGSGLDFVSCINALSPSWCTHTSTTGTTSHNSIVNSAFYDIGALGIRIGLLPGWTDTDANVPQFMTIKNNVVEGVGRVFPSSFAVAQGSGHDNSYLHNDIYDGYHSAIAICEYGCPPGNSNSSGTFNINIAFNHVYNLMQGIMNDTGALYMNTGGPTFIPTGNQILNNKVHDVTDARVMDAGGYGGYGILLDSDTGLVNVQNNLVYRTSDRSIFQTCGPQLPNSANTIKNNVLSFSEINLYGVSCPAPSGVSQFNFSNNLVYYSSPAHIQYGCTYCPAGGNCLPSVQNYSSNLYCDATTSSCALGTAPFRTTTAVCSQVHQSLTWSEWQGLGEDVSSTVADPLFTNPVYPTDDFSLQSGSPATQVGFVPFNVNSPGRTKPTIQAPVIAATFPTANMVAKTFATVSSGLDTSIYGESVNLTAAVSSNYGPPPDGTEITFADSGVTLGTGGTTRGSATLSVPGLTAGEHHITASFAATAFWPATISFPFLQSVSKASSAVVLSSSLNPTLFGQAVQLTATVTSTGGTPTGTVDFKAGSSLLGTGTLSSGVATLSTSVLPVGIQQLTAWYNGDSNFRSSTSSELAQTINQATTVATVASNLNPSKSGQTVTFKATVTSTTTIATGNVLFKSGTKSLGTASLSNGVATLSTNTLVVGTDLITVTYSGTNDVLGTVSLPLSQVVK